LSKHCEFCGRFFVPDHRVGNRQRACSRPGCKAARKQASQKKWVSGEPGYFHGRYPYVKEWRQKRRDKKLDVIQDERPPAKPLLKLVFVVPVNYGTVIQDEITLKRFDRTTFAATGLSRRVIQDTIARPP
jgi:hypothetical protein